MEFSRMMNICMIVFGLCIYMAVNETNSAVLPIGNATLNGENGLIEEDSSLLLKSSHANQTNLSWPNSFNHVNKIGIKASENVIAKYALAPFKKLSQAVSKKIGFENQGNTNITNPDPKATTNNSLWVRWFCYGILMLALPSCCVLICCCRKHEESDSGNEGTVSTDQDAADDRVDNSEGEEESIFESIDNSTEGEAFLAENE